MAKRDGLGGTRKAEKALRLGRTVSAAGPSLLESLERCLLDAIDEWLALKEDLNENDPKRRMKRGEVRGLARAIAKIRLPYEDQRIVTKKIEKEFYRRVKNNG